MNNPKPTLWDNHLHSDELDDSNVRIIFNAKDVKEALKELEQFFKTNEDSEDYDRSLMLTATRLKIKEIFGEELL